MVEGIGRTPPATSQNIADIFEFVQEAYIQLDKEFRFSFVNRSAGALLGDSADSLVGRVLWDVCPEYTGTVFETNYRRTMTERIALAFEDYSERWQRWHSIATWPDRDCGIVVRTVDITERKRAEQTLLESELRFRTLADSGQALIWTSNLDKKCDYFNQPWLDFTGRSLAQELGDGWVEGVHPDDLDRCIEIYTRSFERQERFSMDYRIRRHNGEFGWIQDDGTPRYDGNGRFLGYIGHCLDITGRKRSMAALRESEALLDETGELAKVGGWKIDLGSYELTWSREVRRIHEVDDQFIPTVEKAIAFYVPESQTLIEKAVQDAIKYGKAFDLELEIVTAKGKRCWVQAIGRHRSRDGEADVLLGTFQDISERKKAEGERSQLQLQLAQAQKMESVGRLAGGIAHDFNNLLTVINGFSQMLLGSLKSTDPHREILSQIHKAGERAAGLTRQLLAFSRKQALEPRILNINFVVEQMRPLLERLVGEDVEVQIVLSSVSGMIHADRHQLEQVVMNLAVNAKDAMPHGGRLLVETNIVERPAAGEESCRDANPDRYILLAVSDNGTGMDEDTRRQIFDPFFTTKEVGKGTGLGLSMVQGIVAQSGGLIKVDSECGRGTTFRIYLPASESPAPEKAIIPDETILGGRETILVVEDQAAVRNYVVAVLKEKGYRVIPAEDADEALMHCQNERIDLLLTDVVMPGVGGRELATLVERRHSSIKVLFMSGFTDRMVETHNGLEEHGMILHKPFHPDELARKVRATLDRVTELKS